MPPVCLISSEELLASDTSVLVSTICEFPVNALMTQVTFSDDLRVSPLGGEGKHSQGMMKVIAKVFASLGEANQPTLFVPPLTAVAFDSVLGKWVSWEDTDDRRTIGGFVYPTGFWRDQTDDVLGDVLTEGHVHYDAIPNQKTPEFDAALLGLRSKQLHIQGMVGWR
jgi:hypothetical protein